MTIVVLSFYVLGWLVIQQLIMLTVTLTFYVLLKKKVYNNK